MSYFSPTETKKRSREEERRDLRIQKRFYQDLRYAIDRLPVQESDWRDLLALHHEFGKEGPLQTRYSLIPSWRMLQENLGGEPMPPDLVALWCDDVPAKPITRKIRSDKGKARKRKA